MQPERYNLAHLVTEMMVNTRVLVLCGDLKYLRCRTLFTLELNYLTEYMSYICDVG